MNTITGMPETVEEKRSYLESCGFVIGPRDPARNTAYPGAFMVLEAEEEEGWCIVGDDLDALISQAFNVWWDDYEEAKNLARALKNAEQGDVK